MGRYEGEVEHSIAAGTDSPDGGREAARLLLGSGSQPTAILCVNDFMAIGVLRALREAHLRVPEDVSVVGFDNIGLAAFTQPALTTVHVPRTRIAHLIYHALTSQSEGNSAGSRDIVIDPDLLVRDSTAPAPSTPYAMATQSA